MKAHAGVPTGRPRRRVTTATTAIAVTTAGLLAAAAVFFLLVALESTLATHHSGWVQLPFMRVLGHTLP